MFSSGLMLVPLTKTLQAALYMGLHKEMLAIHAPHSGRVVGTVFEQKIPGCLLEATQRPHFDAV